MGPLGVSNFDEQFAKHMGAGMRLQVASRILSGILANPNTEAGLGGLAENVELSVTYANMLIYALEAKQRSTTNQFPQ